MCTVLADSHVSAIWFPARLGLRGGKFDTARLGRPDSRGFGAGRARRGRSIAAIGLSLIDRR